MIPFVAFFGSAALAIVLTGVYLPLARRSSQLDVPNHRSAHRTLVPSSGGIALMLAFAISQVALWFLFPAFEPAIGEPQIGSLTREPAGAPKVMERLGAAYGAAALLCLLGALDDRHSLPVSLRLGSCVFLSAVAVLPFMPVASPTQALLLLVLAVALAWLINLFNFMDGIDGIASLQCLLTCLTIGALRLIAAPAANLAIATLSLGGVFAGFLFFNWPSARLFMGDAGSLPAGLLLGVLAIAAVRIDSRLVFCWFVSMSPFLLDTGYTLLRRMREGKRITEAHSEHIYQRCFRRYGARSVDLGLLGLHLILLMPICIAASVEFAPLWTLASLTLFPQLFLIAKFRGLQ